MNMNTDNMKTRKGMRPETKEKYSDAIDACRDINNLAFSIKDIAGMYNVGAEALCGHLNRYYPKMALFRRLLRIKMGYESVRKYDLRHPVNGKYKNAAKMLSDSALTVFEAAEICGVSYMSLVRYLSFNYMDLLEARMQVSEDMGGFFKGIKDE